jgi:arsenate reductase (glutaredoxin)
MLHDSGMLKVYAYQKCDSCRKALKWLGSRKIKHEVRAIRETPPSLSELSEMLKARKDLRKLFNTSGLEYKALGLKDKLAGMSEAEALRLLASNGSLVKRPFVLGPGVALLGFKEEEWQRSLE